jgi:hypothetical protein
LFAGHCYVIAAMLYPILVAQFFKSRPRFIKPSRAVGKPPRSISRCKILLLPLLPAANIAILQAPVLQQIFDSFASYQSNNPTFNLTQG